MKTYALPALALCVLLWLGSSCSRYGNELQYVESGRIHVKITDAPFPAHLVTAAYVTVEKIDARRAAPHSGADSDGYTVLFEGSETINIMELTNGLVRSLGAAEVQAGSYDLVRLVISEAYVELEDGTEVMAKVPSGAQSGLKIFIEPGLEVAGELTSELLLDMDLCKSFVFKADPADPETIESVIFKPVIRASNMSFAGSLSGVVRELGAEEILLAGAQIGLYAADTLYTSTLTNAEGQYKFMGIEGGNFTVQAEREGYVISNPVEVLIVPGNTHVKNFALEPAD